MGGCYTEIQQRNPEANDSFSSDRRTLSFTLTPLVHLHTNLEVSLGLSICTCLFVYLLFTQFVPLGLSL